MGLNKIESLKVFKLKDVNLPDYSIFEELEEDAMEYWAVDITPIFSQMFGEDFKVQLAFVWNGYFKKDVEQKAKTIVEKFNKQYKLNYYVLSFGHGAEVYILSQSGKLYRMYSSEYGNISRVKTTLLD